MPTINENFNEDILTLIQDGSTTGYVFNQNRIESGVTVEDGNHYVRMSVFEDGEFIKHYYSNKTWDDNEVYYKDNVP